MVLWKTLAWLFLRSLHRLRWLSGRVKAIWQWRSIKLFLLLILTQISYQNTLTMIPSFVRFLAKVNSRTDIPTIAAAVISGAFSAILTFIFSLDDLVEMVSTVTLLSYAMVSVCVVMLRYQVKIVGLVGQSNLEASTNTHICDSEAPREDSPLSGLNRVRQPSQKTASLALAATVTSCSCFVGLSALIIWGSQALSLAKMVGHSSCDADKCFTD